MRAAALALLLVACSSLEARGGRTVRAGEEPQGTPLGAWRAAECRDAAGGAVELSARVFLVRRADGKPVVVEARPAYDSIVIDNASTSGRQLVFQVAFEESAPVVLHEVRLPANGDGPGQLIVTRAFSPPPSGVKRFHVNYSRAAINCRLDPVAPAVAHADANRADASSQAGDSGTD